MRNKKIIIIMIAFVALIFTLQTGMGEEKAKKKKHPFDVYPHEMHNSFFEMASVACETCHANPESFGDRTKVNPMGCHLCHNSPKPILEANNECALCHFKGPPKPSTHKTDWKTKHQIYAKTNPSSCKQCHKSNMFCMDCHGKRDTIQEKMHRRNFRLFHSIEARANPHRCEACHTVTFCAECHAGRETSKR